MALEPGRLTRAAIHSEAGEAELRMSAAGNWQLAVRPAGASEWRLACSGDLRAGARRAFIGEAPLRLSVKEFALLAVLATDPTRVFTKQELLKSVWGYQPGDPTRTLDSHASRLRVMLRRAGAAGLVVNRRSVGYQLLEADCGAAPSAASP
jgi:DNA-binding response OmpR family regulator